MSNFDDGERLMKSKRKTRSAATAPRERDRLREAARAMELPLTPTDAERLVPAWRRYLALVESLREAMGRMEKQP